MYTYTFILKGFIGSGVFAYSSEDLNTIVVNSAFNINWDNTKISKNKTTKMSFIYSVNNFAYLIRFGPISHIAVYVSERQILYHFTHMNAIDGRHRPIRGRSILYRYFCVYDNNLKPIGYVVILNANEHEI